MGESPRQEIEVKTKVDSTMVFKKGPQVTTEQELEIEEEIHEVESEVEPNQEDQVWLRGIVVESMPQQCLVISFELDRTQALGAEVTGVP